MKQFDRKVALVTGGASGIGKAIAARLSVEGAHVVITDVQADLGQQTATVGGFEFFEQDVTDEMQWTEIIQRIEARYGGLHVLVNNAGILGPTGEASSPESASLESWRRIFSVNAEGVFLGCRAAIPAMRRTGSGSIINISSVAGLLATPDAAAYGASKAVVRHLTKSVAQYCAEQKLGIRCNSVHPGNVRTPLLEKNFHELAGRRRISFAQVLSENKTAIPLGDFTTAEDVAAAVSFLASENARHITGTKLIVDGGIVDCDTIQFAAIAAASEERQGKATQINE